MTQADQYFSAAELSRFRFADVGQHVFISRNASIVHPERIRIGDRARIDSFSLIIAKDMITIGSHVHVGSSVTINAVAPVSLGNFSGLSSGTRIFTADDDYSGDYLTGPTVDQEYTNITTAAVSIGEHCIIGANCVILPGTIMEAGAAVGALSLVRGTLSEWGVYGGIPARHLKPRTRGALKMARQFQSSSKQD